MEDGSIHPADYHDYLSKLHGLDARQVLDAETSGDGSMRDSDGSHTTESFSLSEDPANPQLPEIGKSLNSQRSLIPKAPGKIFSTLMMISKDKWVDRVTQWLNTVDTVTDPDGETVLLANPEKGSLSRRARHLIGSYLKEDTYHREEREFRDDKARTVFTIPKTIQDYQIKADDNNGGLAYIRRYQDGTIHMVLVEKASGKLKDHRLITQRALDPKGGAKGLTVQRVRTSSDRFPSSPAPGGEPGRVVKQLQEKPSADHESFTPPERVREENNAPPETSQDSTSFSLGPANFGSLSGTPLQQAEKFLRILSGKELVTSDGLKASLSNKTAAKMTSWKAVQKSASSEAHLAAIAKLEELFAIGRISGSAPDRDNDPNIRSILR
ncbi:MAG: hypothetical protein EOP84_02290, partial [Verrucomicrobiaceae bacterium]